MSHFQQQIFIKLLVRCLYYCPQKLTLHDQQKVKYQASQWQQHVMVLNCVCYSKVVKTYFR